MNKNTIKIECFACDKSTSNYKYDPQTRRYFGKECLKISTVIREGKEIENWNFWDTLKELKCSECKLPEFGKRYFNELVDRSFPDSFLSWYSGKLMCRGCYQKTDDYHEEQRQKQEKRIVAEAKAKTWIERKREKFKRINGCYPEKFVPQNYKNYVN